MSIIGPDGKKYPDGTTFVSGERPKPNPREWTPDMPARGLGDHVARLTSKLGIKPCGGCKRRQAALNKAFPAKASG